MNTVAIFLSTVAATAAYSIGLNSVGSTLLAIGFLAAAVADYGSRRTAAVTV